MSGSTFHTNLAFKYGGAIATLGTVTVTDSLFNNNFAHSTSGGAALFIQAGTTTVTDSTFEYNFSDTYGGGISLVGGELIVSGSTFNDNRANGTWGGGIYTQSTSPLTIYNSTFYNNFAAVGGGALYDLTSATVTNSTFYGNSSTSGVGGIGVTADGTLNLNNSIIAGSSSGDCELVGGGSMTANIQYSLIEDGSCGITSGVSGNIIGDPMLSALASNSGSTQTMALQIGSPAVNAGSNALAVDDTGATLSYDQRGSDRIKLVTVDMGAYELTYTPDFVVDTTNDFSAACSTGANDCSLRGAITLANAISGTQTITFDSSVFNPGTITLTSDLPAITDALIIDGLGATQVAVDGANSFSILYVDTGVDLTLDGVTIANGSSTDGAGMMLLGGTVTVTNSTFSGNTATGNGGAIYSSSNTDLTVSSSTFSNNTAGSGGAIRITDTSTATVSSSTFSANSASNGGALYPNSSNPMMVINSTFTGNTAVNGGGAISNHGTAIVSGSTFTNNTASGYGGGAIYVSGSKTTVSDTTISGNSAVFGGGIGVTSGQLIVSGSTFSGNSTTTNGNGGGIYTQSSTPATVINSTFYGNSAESGGGFMTAVSTTTITNSTFYGNSATKRGGGVHSAGSGILNLNNSIVAGSTSGGDCTTASGGTFSAQYSLIEDGSCITAGVNGNLTGDPMLSALADNGGATQTMALQDGSPAINAGSNALAVDELGAPLSFDQRGSGSDRIFGSLVDMGAYEATYSYDFVVDTTSGADIEGCSSSPNDCSLRGAITLANAISGTQTITFDSSVFNPGTITLTGNLPYISDALVIDGLGATQVTVDGANSFSMFYVGTVDFTLDGVTIAHSNGSGIYLTGGSAWVSDSTFTGNTSGGIYNTTGDLVVSGSTFTDNTTSSSGGGISSSGTTTIINSTFYNNTAVNGGGFAGFGAATITNSTFSGNSATSGGGGMISYGGSSTIYLNNSILAGSPSGSDCYQRLSGKVIAQNSLIEDGTCGITSEVNGNLIGDPMLSALASNGGSTETMALQLGSPAINAGDNALAVDDGGTTLSYDQRGSGYDRIQNGTVDMGAYELAYTPDFVVDTTSDADLATCSSAPGDCSLRGAINLANTLGGTPTITFDSSIFNPGTITLSSALPPITTDLNITGLGADKVIVDGNYLSALFTISSGKVTIDSVTIRHGNGSTGGIWNSGTLLVTNTIFDTNTANYGGGILNDGTLTVSNSFFSGNQANQGGAIYNTGTATVTNSTLTGNFSYILENTGTMTVTNTTLSGNPGIGLVNDSGALSFNNSIVADSAGGDCVLTGGTVNVNYSLIKDGSCGISSGVNGNLTGDPSLGALTGSPAYFPLNSDSSAINQGDNALAKDAGGNALTTDEAGNTRIQQGTVDLGAYESGFTTPVKQIAFGQQPTDADVDATISPAVTVLLEDVRGNVVTTATDSVSLSISTNPGGGLLGGTASVECGQRRGDLQRPEHRRGGHGLHA